MNSARAQSHTVLRRRGGGVGEMRRDVGRTWMSTGEMMELSSRGGRVRLRGGCER